MGLPIGPAPRAAVGGTRHEAGERPRAPTAGHFPRRPPACDDPCRKGRLQRRTHRPVGGRVCAPTRSPARRTPIAEAKKAAWRVAAGSERAFQWPVHRPTPANLCCDTGKFRRNVDTARACTQPRAVLTWSNEGLLPLSVGMSDKFVTWCRFLKNRTIKLIWVVELFVQCRFYHL